MYCIVLQLNDILIGWFIQHEMGWSMKWGEIYALLHCCTVFSNGFSEFSAGRWLPRHDCWNSGFSYERPTSGWLPRTKRGPHNRSIRAEEWSKQGRKYARRSIFWDADEMSGIKTFEILSNFENSQFAKFNFMIKMRHKKVLPPELFKLIKQLSFWICVVLFESMPVRLWNFDSILEDEGLSSSETWHLGPNS